MTAIGTEGLCLFSTILHHMERNSHLTWAPLYYGFLEESSRLGIEGPHRYVLTWGRVPKDLTHIHISSHFLEQWFSNLDINQNHLETLLQQMAGPHPPSFWFSRTRVGLSVRFSGGADAARSGTTLWEAMFQSSIFNFWTICNYHLWRHSFENRSIYYFFQVIPLIQKF